MKESSVFFSEQVILAPVKVFFSRGVKLMDDTKRLEERFPYLTNQPFKIFKG